MRTSPYVLGVAVIPSLFHAPEHMPTPFVEEFTRAESAVAGSLDREVLATLAKIRNALDWAQVLDEEVVLAAPDLSVRRHRARLVQRDRSVAFADAESDLKHLL